MKCAVCLYVRNEERDITEWIAYHKVLGFDAFLIYDNGSTDGTVANATRAQLVADVRIIDWSAYTRHNAQTECYSDCCRRFGQEFDWIAFIDSDEYFSTPNHELIQSLLGRNGQHSGIALNWALFGSNGHVSYPKGMLIEAFDRRAPDDFGPNVHVKMIVRPSLVTSAENPHYFEVSGQTVDKDGSIVTWGSPGLTKTASLDGWRVHHYFTRSRAHWDLKMARGYRDIVRGEHEFHLYDRNEIRDRSAVDLASPVLALLDAIGLN